ncbi:hypothetical protein [Zhihengliuella salsuginis]|uniref:FtsX-like permease family protein n=1 Tax=Zhihengliuella salsuginis TaxID=578222 RepID=A0ABQ3GCG2_9MICC|nr:hypothetical protein [Zhihengliuella salsuginis]GHD00198.1 hypothetical protein GCM10008096_03180 [Zhihengliuella salsuginis]
MFSPLIIVAGGGVLLWLLVLILRGLVSRQTPRLSDLIEPSWRAAHGSRPEILRHLRRRFVGMIAIAILACVSCLTWQIIAPHLGGLPVVLIPVMVWLAVMVAWSAWPWPRESGGGPDLAAAARPAGTPTHADLIRRGWTTFGPKWSFLFPGALLALLVFGLAAAGLTSVEDESGRLRQLGYQLQGGAELDASGLVTEVLSSVGASGPYPGWYYGGVILVVAFLAAIASLVVLGRNTRRARPLDIRLFRLDNGVRAAVAYTVATLSTAFLAFQGAVVAVMAAAAQFSAAQRTEFVVGEPIDAADITFDPQFLTASIVMLVISVVLTVVGVMLLASCARRMTQAFGVREPA